MKRMVLPRDAARGAVSTALVAGLLAALTGCGGLLPESVSPPPSARCSDLDRRYIVSGAVARGSAVAGVGATAASLVTDGRTQTALRLAGAGLAAVAAVSALLQARAALDYVKTCTDNVGDDLAVRARRGDR